MVINFCKQLTSRVRTRSANYVLAGFLTMIAGATNAGGFLILAQYTSHMTGIVSNMADHLSDWDIQLALSCLAALLAFIVGATVASVFIHRGRMRGSEREYSAPLMLEGCLLLIFAALTQWHPAATWWYVPVAVCLLCFVMGMQNAIITIMTQSELRTTHITGMVTDIGVELGKICCSHRFILGREFGKIRTNSHKLILSIVLVLLFLIGGVLGAYGFKHIEGMFALCIALVLMMLAAAPMIDDIRRGRNRQRQPPQS
jgi:uncharacterized membrane protein YoaK (UPF0700 family)